jgi:hypothetical protein
MFSNSIRRHGLKADPWPSLTVKPVLLNRSRRPVLAGPGCHWAIPWVQHQRGVGRARPPLVSVVCARRGILVWLAASARWLKGGKVFACSLVMTPCTGRARWAQWRCSRGRWWWEEASSPVLCGVPVTATDGEVKDGSDGVLLIEKQMRSAPQH